MASVEEIAQSDSEETLALESQYQREQESAMNKYLALVAAYMLSINKETPPDPGQIKIDLTLLAEQAGIVAIYQGLTDEYQGLLDRKYAMIDDMVAGEKTLAEEELAKITAKAQTDLMANMSNLDVMISDQTAIISNYALGVLPDADANSQLQYTIDTLSNKNTSAITTDIFSTSRLALMVVAGAYALNRFLYSGPRDEKNRPFCAAHVGKIYPKYEIDRMDNEMLNPVMIFAGGYNCRHEWQPVGI